ncbi:hypothetical protein ERJ75_000361200 [Trypanosoma vivax]|uniref:Uncharacterized protein n=1 Tax=Trypanosoma vivax (strain Y486) TaxID=1055687 RepID=G0TUQ4_TRYVY|nr:hypothetical protein ERJ75_000361200 [Trypanosoma vivax]CCC47689.1 conserved hypothetical protein [Trypanosoma vivax Y486]
MSDTARRTYLRERVGQHYLDVLPSRWRALLHRLAQKTQGLQRHDILQDTSLQTDLRADFELANALLEEEHRLYQEGASLFLCNISSSSLSDCGATAPVSLLQGMLSCIAVKELAMSHWQAAVTSIPPDTMRVYCHVCVAHPFVQLSDVERACAFYSGQ